MKLRYTLALAAAALALPMAANANANAREGRSVQRAEVVARDTHGHATQVQVDGQVYAVCTSESQDDCINPREAGLKFGNVPLDHFPANHS